MIMHRERVGLFCVGILFLLGGCAAQRKDPGGETQFRTSSEIFSGDERAEATLDDYWDGFADWSAYSVIPINGVSARFRVGPDGKWYVFHGIGMVTDDANICPDADSFTENGRKKYRIPGFAVRVSEDAGKTWGPDINVIDPTKNGPRQPWSCAAVDGDAFYDQGRWHLVGQCAGKCTDDDCNSNYCGRTAAGKCERKWNVCHWATVGSSATSGWVDPHPYGTNPVIKNGQLWSQVCKPGTACHEGRPVFDEGTPQIVGKDGGGGIYLSLHGQDGLNLVRGIFKSTLWTNWVAGSQFGLPEQPIFDRHISDRWRENWATCQGQKTFGGGAGATIWSGKHFYSITEAIDVATYDRGGRGQSWNAGINRAATLTQGAWEEFPQGNPVLYSTAQREAGTSEACNSNSPTRPGVSPAVYYPGLFKDNEGSVYRNFGRVIDVSTVYLHKLRPNVLKNNNGWKCLTAEPWQKLSGDPGRQPNLAIYRDPKMAYGGNCAMVANCGSDRCDALASVFQDVRLSETRLTSGQRMSYGGVFAALSSQTDAKLELVVFQLDDSGVVQRDAIVGTIPRGTTQYGSIPGGGFTISPRAKRLRFQIHMMTPNVNYAIGETYLRPK